MGPAGPSPAAAGACKAVGEITDGDGDFTRNAAALGAPGLCLSQTDVSERERDWVIQTVSSGRPGPLWAVMHDDEDVAFDDAVQALTTYGGTLVSVDANGKRNLDGVDPNRNFSAGGIGCSKLGNDATPEFTAVFKALFDPTQPIIALHNNAEGVGGGRVGHVTIDRIPPGMDLVASSNPESDLADNHTLVLIASPQPVPGELTNRANSLAAKGVNVIIEAVREGRGDCSLSNYAVLSGHPTYLNVTVDHDGGDKQRRIVALLMSNLFTVAASAMN